MGIVERIKIKAKIKGETLTSIERELNFSKSSIRKWDEQSPSIDKLIKVAEYLNVTIDYLATGKEKYEIMDKWNKLDYDEKKIIEQQIDTIIAIKERKAGKLSS